MNHKSLISALAIGLLSSGSALAKEAPRGDAAGGDAGIEKANCSSKDSCSGKDGCGKKDKKEKKE